jgi:hypothetical protein
MNSINRPNGYHFPLLFLAFHPLPNFPSCHVHRRGDVLSKLEYNQGWHDNPKPGELLADCTPTKEANLLPIRNNEVDNQRLEVVVASRAKIAVIFLGPI